MEGDEVRSGSGSGGSSAPEDGESCGNTAVDADPDPRLVVVSFDIGVKNLAVCVMDYGGVPQRSAAAVLDWRILALAAEKERIPPLNELSGRLFMVLDELIERLAEEHGIEVIDHVLLENQPSRLNGSMKSIQMMIYAYFQLRRHWEGRVSAVQMVSARDKTRDHEGVEIPTPQSQGRVEKKGYELNKWNAIWIARHYIRGDAELERMFEGAKKRDDLADALCQSIAWARKHRRNVERVAAAQASERV